MNERLNVNKVDLENNVIDLNVLQTVMVDYAYNQSIEWDDDVKKEYDVNIQMNEKDKEIAELLESLICKEEITLT